MAAVIAESYPAISLPLPFDPVFYTWREVDVIARLHGEGSPPYPAAAREAGLSGRITLEVWVDETGHVHEVKVIDATPHGYFEAAALAHYRAARFSPAMKDGQPRRFHARFLLEFSEPAQEPQ